MCFWHGLTILKSSKSTYTCKIILNGNPEQMYCTASIHESGRHRLRVLNMIGVSNCHKPEEFFAPIVLFHIVLFGKNCLLWLKIPSWSAETADILRWRSWCLLMNTSWSRMFASRLTHTVCVLTCSCKYQCFVLVGLVLYNWWNSPFWELDSKVEQKLGNGTSSWWRGKLFLLYFLGDVPVIHPGICFLKYIP